MNDKIVPELAGKSTHLTDSMLKEYSVGNLLQLVRNHLGALDEQITQIGINFHAVLGADGIVETAACEPSRPNTCAVSENLLDIIGQLNHLNARIQDLNNRCQL